MNSSPVPSPSKGSAHAGSALAWVRMNSLNLFVLSAICGVAVWRWQLVWSSILTLCLWAVSLYAPAGHGRVHIASVVPLLEYWAASSVLACCGTASAARLIKSWNRKGQFSNGDTGALFRVSKSLRVNTWIFLTSLFVAVEAPLLAPLDPAMQGNLTTTRLLTPLTRGAFADAPTASISTGNDRDESSTGSWIYAHALSVLRGHGAETTAAAEEGPPARSEGTTLFWLGTDNLGRDVLSRLLYALRISVLIGMCATFLSLVLGCIVGLAAVLSGQAYIDQILMRMVDLFLSVPALFLVIVIVAFAGNSAVVLVCVLAGTGWMSIARMVRGEVLHLREREFVLAAQMLGRSSTQIAVDHMIPNMFPMLVAAVVFQLGNVVLAEASLSFLGLGVQPPTPSLGNMIGESLSTLDRGWWVGVMPGAVLVLFLLSVNRLAEHLYKAVTTGTESAGGVPG